MDAEITAEMEGKPVQGGEDPGQAPSEQELHRPLLRVDRTQGMDAQRHILIPVDDTDDSEMAINWALNTMYRHGDVLHLLHVIPEPAMVHVWAGMYVPPDDDAELIEIEDTKQFVKHRFAQKLVQAKAPFMLHVIVGSVDSEAVAKVVAKKAQEINAEAIVVARHNRGKIKEFFVGSVTKALIKYAPVPLAVVPPNQ